MPWLPILLVQGSREKTATVSLGGIAVQVRRIAWLGVGTDAYEATVSFLHEVLGLQPAFQGPGTAELVLPNDDRVQVFGPGDRYYEFYAEHAVGPVVLFEVDDVEGARAELEAAGIELVGPTDSDSAWSWVHARAPDGNLYAFASRRPAGG
jgi:catechol 2,3-dioxygenase-like lactoylglutathione lyase family enzyme